MSLTPKEITPVDDAFHGSKKHVAVEWWYFDAVFDNSYSVHVGFKTFSRKNFGLVSPMIEIYREGNLEAKASGFYPFNVFQTSKKIPVLKLFGKPIVRFDHERFNERKEWAYNVSMKVKDCEVDLYFVGISKGWKIETKAESWTVALPKALVTGEIKFKGECMSVEGVGYHDHNWNYTLLTVMNYGRGWYWGRINTKKFTIVWANILRKSYKWEPLAVLSQEKGGFIPVNPDAVFFERNGFVRSHGRRIPTCFKLKIDDKTGSTPVQAEVVMKAKNIHCDSVAVLLPYFRYHVETKGIICVGSEKERIKGVQIMESLSFG